mgnify:CR=1 FL=1
MALDVAKVYINGRLIGFHKEPDKLTKELIGLRRKGKLQKEVNIAFHEDTNEIYVNTDAGRVQRPVIVVEAGKSKLAPELAKQVVDGKLGWNELVKEGIIEYLDPEEEENALIEQREQLRRQKNFAEADKIRAELKSRGILLEDTPQGVRWKKG